MSRKDPRQDVADVFGRPRHVVYFVRGGAWSFAARGWEPPDLQSTDFNERLGGHCQAHDHRASHYFRILLDACRDRVTPKQYEAIEQLIVLGRGLHELARERGGSVESWRQRIEGKCGRGGIRDKAPELYAVWVFRNRTRRDISEVISAINRAIAYHRDKSTKDGMH